MITRPLASTVLPDAGSNPNRENGNAAKSLTWRGYLVAGLATSVICTSIWRYCSGPGAKIAEDHPTAPAANIRCCLWPTSVRSGLSNANGRTGDLEVMTIRSSRREHLGVGAKFDLKTASILGLTVPSSLLATADEVIEYRRAETTLPDGSPAKQNQANARPAGSWGAALSHAVAR